MMTYFFVLLLNFVQLSYWVIKLVFDYLVFLAYK